MTSTDYSGRMVDLLMFQGVKPAGEAAITLGLGDAGEICTGAQKLSQSFALLFLTRKGSIDKHPEWGTDFVTACQQGRINKERDVQSEFSTAAELVRRTLSTEWAALPKDEKLVSATLQSFSKDRDAAKLILYVKLRTAAGKELVIVLPVGVAIR
jgi:hypothetical protein